MFHGTSSSRNAVEEAEKKGVRETEESNLQTGGMPDKREWMPLPQAVYTTDHVVCIKGSNLLDASMQLQEGNVKSAAAIVEILRRFA